MAYLIHSHQSGMNHSKHWVVTQTVIYKEILEAEDDKEMTTL